MARAREEHVREPALLVHDPRGHAVVVEPRRRGPAREALHAAPGDVLDDDLGAVVLVLRVVVARVEDEGDVGGRGGGVGEEVGQECDGLDGRVAVEVADALVVDGAEGVVEAPRPVLGRRRVQRGAPEGGVEEGSSVERRFGVRGVGDVVHVEAAVGCKIDGPGVSICARIDA